MQTESSFNSTINVIQARLKHDIEEIEKRLKKNPKAVEKYYNSTKNKDDNQNQLPDDEYDIDDEENSSNCKFNIFFKLKSVNTTDGELLEYENELKKPTGIRPLLKSVPPLEGDSLLYSENCKLYLKLNNSAQGISQIMISFLNLIVITVNILMGTSVDGYNSILYITAASFKGISFIFFEKIYILKVIERHLNFNDNGNANILLICYYRPSINFIYIIISYTILQILILSLQNIYGPLFLIPEKFLPQRYNYHPILPIYNEKDEAGEEGEEEEHVDANDASASAPLERISVNQECAICFTNIVENNKVNNKDYMVTPCHHIFHTECLKHWMVCIIFIYSKFF
ncbi:hypothetical protein PIROE2DRAFT_61249 [Piromyces sp. E2]|nr:hypothetical protein PIROE2DRAFT_61249 [Piromyces sp. E2]|eukprot:OUM63472.1 hypothetical protein PIROE2DRAFT_61249 [Piromyces sp. E2]